MTMSRVPALVAGTRLLGQKVKKVIPNMRALTFMLALLVAGPARAALESTDPQPVVPGQLTRERWSQDIDALVAFLRDTHPDLDAAVSERELDSAARQLKSQLPTLDRQQVIAGIMRIVALVRDDSTSVYPFQNSIAFGLIPVLAYWFSDGLYVIDASGEAEPFIGYRITRIGDTTIDQAFLKLSPFLNGENMQGRRFLFTRNAFIPELLYAAGLSSSPYSAMFSFESPAGVVETVSLTAAEVDAWKPWNARVVSFDADNPVFARHRNDAFWFEYMPESDMLFMRVTQLRDQDKETVAAFADRLRAFADKQDFERFVIDARYGGGGSGHAMDPLVDVITNHPRINRAGRLFGTIGRVTRGTVLEFISVLQNNSRMVMVGESTLDAPNGVGDPTVVTLPNSSIEVAITEVFWPTSFADDPRQAIAPDVTVLYSYNDWKQARDPAIAAVTNHQSGSVTPQPIPDTIFEHLPGEYEVGPGQIVAITQDGDTLAFAISDSEQLAGQSFFRARSDLHAQNETRLRSDIRDVFIEFEYSSDGHIQQPILIWRGVPKPLLRVSERRPGVQGS